ncbi:MAG: type II toxin-antitoxin system prevent-host-death family antitoxin [Acidobacteriota bacterium]
MRRTSITDAKNRLSALLDRVRHGETILIEDRGVAVAQIGPVGRGDYGVDRDRLASLERAGVVRPAIATKPSRLLLTKPPRPKRPEALSRMVADERAEGW